MKVNPEKEAQSIANAGYATDSNYAEKLVKLGNGRSVKGESTSPKGGHRNSITATMMAYFAGVTGAMP